MATIKEAVHNASVFATETLGRERTEGLRLEEVESTDVGGHEAWLITLSMVAPPQSTIGAVNAALYALAEPKRDYKIFRTKDDGRRHLHEDSGTRRDVMLDALALMNKHRSKGVLVDTNLLVLLLVGSVNRRRILEFKRTQSFTMQDFDLLSRLIAWFEKLITTPHVLSQVSDLTDLAGEEFWTVRGKFASLVELMDDSYDECKALVSQPRFSRLGLTDAAIATVCSRGILVLTTDVQLELALQQRGADALNFNHVRSLGLT